MLILVGPLVAADNRAAEKTYREGLRHLAGDDAGAIEDLKARVKLTPENAEAWRLWGEAHHRAGQQVDAIDAFDRAIALKLTAACTTPTAAHGDEFLRAILVFAGRG